MNRRQFFITLLSSILAAFGYKRKNKQIKITSEQIALIRRRMPNLIAYDICGVQPMKMPTGLIFAMKSRYKSSTTLFNEADTDYKTIDYSI